MTSELSEGFPKVEISGEALDEDVVKRAQLRVCRDAKNISDAKLLLDMLGIHPNQEEPLSREARAKLIKELRRPILLFITRKRRGGVPLTEDEEDFLKNKLRIE